MKRTQEFIIEIGTLVKSASSEGYPVSTVMGRVCSEPGEYQILPEIGIKVCPVRRKEGLPAVQKIIFREAGYRRRTVLVHHNAEGPVIQDLNSVKSLTFRVGKSYLRQKKGGLLL